LADVLDLLLAEFGRAMRAKFVARELKHPGATSVTHPDFDWENGLDAEAITRHLLEEVIEWTAARGRERAQEAVDVANLAFLSWVLERRP